MKRTTGSYTSYTQAVTDAKAGVQEAFTFLYESTYRDKRYIAQKYMHSEADAEDVLQEAYVKAWRNLDQLKEAEKFPGWLSLIVSSTALDALRKKKELPFSVLGKESDEGDAFEYEEEDWRAEYQPEHAYTDKETSELLRELLDALSEEQRFCMLMYYVEEHSVAEIAEIIGCSEGTVKSRLNYGRKNLREKAADMEKKGYTLYSFPPVALLLYLLRMEAKAASFVIPAIDTAAAAAMAKSGAAAGSASGASTTAGGTTSGAAGSAASGAGGTTAGAAASGAGGAGAAAATATATAAVAAKVAGFSLGVKIAAAVLAVAVIGGGGFAAIRHRQSSSVAQEQTAETVSADGVNAELLSATADSGITEPVTDTGTTDNEFDEPEAGFDRIELVVMYHPDATLFKVIPGCVKGEHADHYTYRNEALFEEYPPEWLLQSDIKESLSVTEYWHSVGFGSNGDYENYRFVTRELDKVYKDFYKTSIDPYMDVIHTTYLEIAQLHADQKLEPYGNTFTTERTNPRINVTDKMPEKLLFTIDGQKLEMDVIKAEIIAIGNTVGSETEPETIIPYWKNDNGRYYYINAVRVSFMVPSEQTAPLFAFLDSFVEEARREEEARQEEIKQREAEKETKKEEENNGEESVSASSIVGTWYDPTGLSVGVYTFYEDGTGIEDLGGSTTISFKYTISGNTLSYTFKGFTHTLTISGDRLVDGYGAKYIKK